MKKKILVLAFVVSAILNFLLIGLQISNVLSSTIPLGNRYQLKESGAATISQPVISPDRNFKLVVSRGYDGDIIYETFHIIDYNTNDVVYAWDMYIRTLDRHEFGWTDDSDIYVYSGDIGYMYINNNNGIWGYDKHNESNLSPVK